jgi:tetratricopeptide (TPR) repeat protein
MAYEAYQAGKTKAGEKQYQEAIASFQKAIEVGDPDKSYDANIIDAAKKGMAAATLNMGTALRNEKDFEGALNAYVKAMELGQDAESDKVVEIAVNNGTRVAYVRGNELKNEEQYEAALAVYEKGIMLDSTYYKNFLGRAQSLEELGQPLESMKVYMTTGDICTADTDEEVMEKGERMYNKAANMVAVTWSDKDWDTVVEMANVFLEARQDADVHYYLGDALLEKGMADEALVHAAKAMELNAENADDTGKYLMLKGGALEAQGKTAEAVEAYKAVSGKYGESASYRIKELTN